MMTITSPRRRSIESMRRRAGGAYAAASNGAVVAAAVAIKTSDGRRGWSQPLLYGARARHARWNIAQSPRTSLTATFFRLIRPALALKSMAQNTPADVVIIGGGPGGYV